MEILKKPVMQEKVFSPSKKVLIIHSNIQDAINALFSLAQPERKWGEKSSFNLHHKNKSYFKNNTVRPKQQTPEIA